MYTFSLLMIIMGHHSVNIEYGGTVLALCTLSDHGLYLYQVLLKYLEQFKSYGTKPFQYL